MPPAADLVPRPSSGRVFERSRRVRLGDASPAGRMRLDAVARYLQDVSSDDTRATGFGDGAWVVRRTVLHVEQFPVYDELLWCSTFCSGTGPRWAERRVDLVGDRGGHVVGASLWVHLDHLGRPTPLPDGFLATYGEAASGRTVRARLRHAEAPAGVGASPWPLRFTDFDVMGHLNNASSWVVVEEHLAVRRALRAPLRAEVEFRAAVEPGDAVSVVAQDGDDGFALWIVDQGDGGVRTSATVEAA